LSIQANEYVHKPAKQLNHTTEKMSNINSVDETFELW